MCQWLFSYSGVVQPAAASASRLAAEDNEPRVRRFIRLGSGRKAPEGGQGQVGKALKRTALDGSCTPGTKSARIQGGPGGLAGRTGGAEVWTGAGRAVKVGTVRAQPEANLARAGLPSRRSGATEAARETWMEYRTARGMRDVLPAEIPRWERLESEARRLARAHGFREIRPPLLEETELFVRSVGEVTDIVEKEMFSVAKEGSSLTLRPEATAGIARAYLQSGFAKTAPLQKLFTIGPMFRYERPQKGRERQFTQFDVECLGSLDPRLDAELVHMAAQFFERLGIVGIEVRVNSLGDGDDRDRYREAVRAYVEPQLQERDDLCRSRFERNVLRVLDCKNPRCVELNKAAP